MSQRTDSTIRFIAKSAQEAAAIVQERLGPEGRVISVEQVTGSGLKRFISSPQLQIVAKKQGSGEKVQPAPVREAVAPDAEEAPTEPGQEASAESPSVPVRGRPELSCRNLLLGAGFSSSLMARLEGARRWRELCDLPAGEGLPQAVAWLRQYRAKAVPFQPTSRIAFIGCAGAGKTTALCKFLARELFLYDRTPEVLQLEVDKPHMDSGLSIYCDILGVPCYEDPGQVTGSGTLLVDVPGFSPGAEAEQAHLEAALEAIGASHRVMVMNAAYESAVLEKHAGIGRALGATHRAYTHLDELDDVSKLWAGVLDPDCATLFFSNGQNVAGNLIEDSFGYLIERTFPR